MSKLSDDRADDCMERMPLDGPREGIKWRDGVCEDVSHNASRNFQQIKTGTCEATCRCWTCGRNWQEYYTLQSAE